MGTDLQAGPRVQTIFVFGLFSISTSTSTALFAISIPNNDVFSSTEIMSSSVLCMFYEEEEEEERKEGHDAQVAILLGL